MIPKIVPFNAHKWETDKSHIIQDQANNADDVDEESPTGSFIVRIGFSLFFQGVDQDLQISTVDQ